MKNQLIPFFVLIFTLTTQISVAQVKKINKEGKGTLRFKTESIDLGTLKEEGGPKEAVFVCYNISQFPVVIKDVKTSCGCTGADWSRDTIQPGDSGFVTAIYDPKGRPEPFEKAIWAYTDGVPYQYFLTINGNVTPKPITKEDSFPSKFGKLMMTTNYFNLGFVYRDEIGRASAKIYNSSKDTIRILGISGRPSYLTMEASSLVILPESEIELTMVYDAKASNEYGDMLYYLQMSTNDRSLGEMQLHVQVHVLERFPKMSKRQEAKAPKISFEQEEISYGKVLKGDTITVRFTMKNEGKKTLKIRKLQPSCGCTAAVPSSNEVNAGESVELVVTFYTNGRVGVEDKTITVITNDPKRPIAKITIKGEVVENPNAL